MQSKKQKLDVGSILTGLRDRGQISPEQARGVRSASTTPAAPQAAGIGKQYNGTASSHRAAVRVGGIVLRHISAGDYRAIQDHIAAGGQVDIMFVFS